MKKIRNQTDSRADTDPATHFQWDISDNWEELLLSKGPEHSFYRWIWESQLAAKNIQISIDLKNLNSALK